ncbi:serine/threonine-protein phosphatase [Streptacidiphilus sp. PB12-B1b]|uniref:PP2C family protein-serine/threonine phosphatase n=1 Tax=Streptacidiphilus sp. PB12-B1b TaxID=2705012 RepID=UPI0015FA19D5|nr:PP2C family protein-serine/threonine phosphatase [Streptacidiphilus sp. PB12-B1b]QMU77817.1 serine/threonine-protein phosphatase [Streptacidiphilus sp. PB12-B1b]
MAGVSDTRPGLPPVLLSRRVRGFLTAAYLLLAAAVGTDLATGPGSTFSPVLAAVPVLAGIGTRRARVPVVAGLLALAGVIVLALVNQGVPLLVHATSAVTVLVITCTSAAAVVLVASREQELAQVRSVSEAAQRALLRPVPERIGALRIAVRYLAAEAEARIGGDLYEVLSTAYGTRVILGDVRGKGLPAVETAADVLGVFRDAARSEPDLAVVAGRIDAALARRPQSEEFVTAVLLDLPEREGPARLVNCGHPDPFLCHAAGVSAVEPPLRLPPLAMNAMVGVDYQERRFDFAAGDTLLLYTDGVSEARDAAGVFYPLAQRLRGFGELEPAALLDRLIADVRAYVPDGMNDDAAVLAVHREHR